MSNLKHYHPMSKEISIIAVDLSFANLEWFPTSAIVYVPMELIKC